MKITIPTDQSEITLAQYIKAHDKEEREQIAIYLNLNLNQLDQLPASIYDEALAAISEAMQQEPKHVKRFRIKDTEFGFVPDLNDIETSAFAMAENTQQEQGKAHEFINCLYRPITRQAAGFYSVKDYDPKGANYLLDAPLSAYTSSLLFFCNIAKDLGIYTQNSIQ